MKVFFITLFFSLNAFSLDGLFYRDALVMEQNLDALSGQQDFSFDITKKQVERIMHKFMNEQMRSEDIAQEFEFMITRDGVGPIGDVYKKIEELLGKIYGSKIGKVIVAVMGFAEVKSSIEDIYEGIKLLQEKPSCEAGMTKLSTGASFIVGFVGVYYFMQNNPAALFLAKAGGLISKKSCEMILDITDLPKITCGFLHKGSLRMEYGF